MVLELPQGCVFSQAISSVPLSDLIRFRFCWSFLIFCLEDEWKFTSRKGHHSKLFYSTLQNIPDKIPLSFLYSCSTPGRKSGTELVSLGSEEHTEQQDTPHHHHHQGSEKPNRVGPQGCIGTAESFFPKDLFLIEPQSLKNILKNHFYLYSWKKKREREKNQTMLASRLFRRNQLGDGRLGCWDGSSVNRFFRASVSLSEALILPVDLFANL